MAKPTRTKSGKWRIQVFLGYDENGKRLYHKQIVETYKEGVQLIAMLQLQRTDGKKKTTTVKQGLQKYIMSVDAIHSPSTIAGYKQMARNAYKGIENIPIEDLTQADVQAFVNQYAVDHNPKTVRNANGLLSRMLRFMGRDGFKHISLPAKNKPRITIPTDDELATCLNLAGHPGMRQAILLAAGAGMRRGEIAALEWKHINYEDSTLLIEQAYVKGEDGTLHLNLPKTALSERTILVGKDIMEGFQALPNKESKHPVNLTPDAITRRFQRICAKAGFKFRFHDLRHYQASIMLAEGVPDKYAMERMGHSSANMLRNVYQHTMSDMQQKFSSQLNDRFSDRLSKALKTKDSDQS